MTKQNRKKRDPEKWLYDPVHKAWIDVSASNPKLRKLLEDSAKIR